jgi:hypothetical protein
MVTEAARNMLTTWSSKPRPVWPNNQEKWRIPSCYGHFDRKMMRNSRNHDMLIGIFGNEDTPWEGCPILMPRIEM